MPSVPIVAPGVEIVPLEAMVAALHAHLDTVTEWDTNPMGAVLHAAHLLKLHQGADAKWPDTINARTAQPVGEGRSFAPVSLFLRLDAMLDSFEFRAACDFAEAGGFVLPVEMLAK